MSTNIVQGSGISALAARMRRVAKDMDDLTDLGRKVRAVIAEGNKDDRLAGRNRFGHKMPSVSPKLQKDRERRGRGRGPFLAPGTGRDPRESRTITNHFTRVVSGRGEDGLRIEWGWRAVPWLRFWNAQAKTDISGISPTTGRRIGEAIRAHLGGDIRAIAFGRAGANWVGAGMHYCQNAGRTPATIRISYIVGIG